MANCTRPRGPLEAENDIVGPGALAAFFATAAITYLTVIVAYITDTLDKDLINPFDAKVVEMTKKVIWRSKPKNQDPEPGMNQKAASRPGHSADAVKKARRDTISNFLISLSDQQLVTGLAVLVAAVSGQQSLTGYDFSVATSLGWFSCTTHLATIDVLCVRFKRHKVIRHVRVIGLVCLMGLLSYAFIRTTSIGSFRIPIDCPRNAPWVHYTDVLCLLPLWIDYFSAIRKIYLGPPTSFWNVAELNGLKSRRDECSGVDQLAAKKTETQTNEIESLVAKSEEHARSRLGLLLYDGSFLETFPDMTYTFCFGIAQVVVYRWDAPELSEESTEMGFGQITALLLLILPFLAIGEAWTCELPKSSPPCIRGQRITSQAYYYLAYSQASRRGLAIKEEADSPGQDPEKGSHGIDGDPEKTKAVGPQATESTKPQELEHLPPGQSSTIAESVQQDTLSDGAVNLERIQPNVADASLGSNSDKDTSGLATHRQNLKDDKDLEQYFPLSMKELSALDDNRELRTARQSLLRRCDSVKIAENNLGLRRPLAFFGLHLCTGVMASVFLNSYDYRLELAGTALNVLSVVLGNLKSVRRLLRLFQDFKNRSRKG